MQTDRLTRRDFRPQLTDAQLGFLSGGAFSLFNAIFGLVRLTAAPTTVPTTAVARDTCPARDAAHSPGPCERAGHGVHGRPMQPEARAGGVDLAVVPLHGRPGSGPLVLAAGRHARASRHRGGAWTDPPVLSCPPCCPPVPIWAPTTVRWECTLYSAGRRGASKPLDDLRFVPVGEPRDGPRHIRRRCYWHSRHWHHSLPPFLLLVLRALSSSERWVCLGIPAGILLGLLLGGWLTELVGWRAAFVAVGLPGLSLAVLTGCLAVGRPRPVMSYSAAPPSQSVAAHANECGSSKADLPRARAGGASAGAFRRREGDGRPWRAWARGLSPGPDGG